MANPLSPPRGVPFNGAEAFDREGNATRSIDAVFHCAHSVAIYQSGLLFLTWACAMAMRAIVLPPFTEREWRIRRNAK